jgi:hypothetical protein
MDSYDRRPGKRPPGRCILIVCEGAETEPNYFESLRDYLKLSTISVKIKDRAGAPINVVEEALAQVEQRLQDFRDGRTNAPPFEAIWCVFDVENPHHNQTFDRAVQVAAKMIFSWPSLTRHLSSGMSCTSSAQLARLPMGVNSRDI